MWEPRNISYSNIFMNAHYSILYPNVTTSNFHKLRVSQKRFNMKSNPQIQIFVLLGSRNPQKRPQICFYNFRKLFLKNEKTCQFAEFCDAKTVLLCYKTREIPVIFYVKSMWFLFSIIAIPGHFCSQKTLKLESRDWI